MLENMRLAWEAIRANKMRSILTMLGMIIGIGSVIAIVSIGDTMRSVIADEYAGFGINRGYLYVSWNEDGLLESDQFTADELEEMQHIFADEIQYIAPLVSGSMEVTYRRTNRRFDLTGVAAGYADVQPTDIVYGRMINESDIKSRRKNVVIDLESARELFGIDNPTGMSFPANLNGELDEVTIVGVYKLRETALSGLMGMSSGDRGTGFIAYSVLVPPGVGFFDIDLYAAEGIDTAAFQSRLCTYAGNLVNRPAEQIVYYSAAEEMGEIDRMMGGLSSAVGAIAAISLLVGGIGIMNIMMVSVTERTREIGIRKALGARTRDVLMQFLTESAMISAAGGIIGIALGVGIVSLGGLLLGIGAVVKPSVVIIAVAFSALVGICFGLYPAMKAAKADPIDALRYE